MRVIAQNIRPENKLISLIQNNQYTQRDVSKFFALLLPLIKIQVNKYGFNLRNVDVDELSNDIFVKVFYKLEQFNPEKGNVFSWAKTIAKNSITDLFRKQKASKCQSLDLMLENGFNCEIKGDYTTPETEIIRKEQRKELHSYLEKLTGINRELFFGFYFENKSISELAIEYAFTCNAVSVRLNRLRSHLKNAFEKDGIKVDNP
jgi:RNA polymerase sigma-70 factor (ECF subfamily)